MADKLKKMDYEDRLEALHQVLSNLHGWLAATSERVLVILEGCDTAGKTGGINAITHPLNPRRVQVVALSKPSEREAGRLLLSRTAVSELGERLWADYQDFATHDLGEYDIAHLFVDGIAERIRPGQRREPVLAAWASPQKARRCCFR